MEWKTFYLDIALVPPALLLMIIYHIYLWYNVKNNPHLTIAGVNSVGRRLWVETMLEDSDKKNILAIQSMRNMIMASTLVATISILLTIGLAAVISSTYKLQSRMPDKSSIVVLGGGGGGGEAQALVAAKYVTPLVLLVMSFFCSSVSIRMLNQVNYLINIPLHEPALITPAYVACLLERGCIFSGVATRMLYTACPLLLWIVGPVPVLLTTVALLPVLYNLDFVFLYNKSHGEAEPEAGPPMSHCYRIT